MGINEGVVRRAKHRLLLVEITHAEEETNVTKKIRGILTKYQLVRSYPAEYDTRVLIVVQHGSTCKIIRYHG